MSVYLSSGDLTTYGVPTATAAQVIQASGAVDAYLKRPEGILYSPDFQGYPCYMTAMTPNLTFNIVGSISPGQYVQATVTGMVTNDLIGEVLIVDRATPNLTEALVVTAVNGQLVTFLNVKTGHAANSLLEQGMVLLEERPLAQKRSVTRVSKFPLVRVLSGSGRCAYGRRSDQVAGLYNDVNLIATLETFGGPPAWMYFDVSACSVSAATGEVWVPASVLLAYYSDVRMRYVAGYPAANVPVPIKVATAAIVNALIQYSDLAGNVKKIAAGGTSIERFANTALDADTKQMIDGFAAKLLY